MKFHLGRFEYESLHQSGTDSHRYASSTIHDSCKILLFYGIIRDFDLIMILPFSIVEARSQTVFQFFKFSYPFSHNPFLKEQHFFLV